MREGARGFEAPLGGGGNSLSVVKATFDGAKFTGTFAYDYSELSFHCQTGSYYFSPYEIPFEATRYEPVENGATLASGAEEIPVYFLEEESIESFLEIQDGSIVVRGGVRPTCPVEGARRAGTHAAFFSDVVDSKSREGGRFRKRIRSHNEVKGGRRWSESSTISGIVNDTEITGLYLRSTQIRRRSAAPIRCVEGPIPFRAIRYLPAP